MKILRALAAAALLLLPLSAQAFTYGTPSETTTFVGNTVATVTPSCAASGSDVVVWASWNSGGGTITISSVTDGTSYTQEGSTLTTGAGYSSAVYLLTSAASGTHTVHVTFSGATTGYVGSNCVGGAGAADGAAGLDNNFSGTAANAIKGGSITTTVNGDAVLGIYYVVSGTATLSVGTSPNAFITMSYTTAGSLGEQFTQSSAGAVQATATASANVDTAGFTLALKASAAACTNYAWTSGGAIVVPTPGSTVVWLKNGTFGTVDCSSVNYLQPKNGNAFGVN